MIRLIVTSVMVAGAAIYFFVSSSNNTQAYDGTELDDEDLGCFQLRD